MRIGPYSLPNNLAVAPMAGVTDRPFRQLCKRLGAGYAVSEMVASNPRLWGTDKSRRRTDHEGEVAPIAVQIAGADPGMMVDAARYNVARGAADHRHQHGLSRQEGMQCRGRLGAARRRGARRAHPARGGCAQSTVPVTLKIRTGSDPAHRNALTIARIAEDAGIAALAVHGRTRACLFVGAVEYATIAAVKRAVSIPVIANGDIGSPADARRVLAVTGADGLMIGRAAQGRPWIFREIAHFLATGAPLAPPTVAEARALILEHLADHHAFYGEAMGVRIARKHLGWYTRGLRRRRSLPARR